MISPLPNGAGRLLPRTLIHTTAVAPRGVGLVPRLWALRADLRRAGQGLSCCTVHHHHIPDASGYIALLPHLHVNRAQMRRIIRHHGNRLRPLGSARVPAILVDAYLSRATSVTTTSTTTSMTTTSATTTIPVAFTGTINITIPLRHTCVGTCIHVYTNVFRRIHTETHTHVPRIRPRGSACVQTPSHPPTTCPRCSSQARWV